MSIISLLEIALLCLCLCLALYALYRPFSAQATGVAANPIWETSNSQPRRGKLQEQLAALNLDITPLMLLCMLSTLSVCVLLSFLEIFPGRPWIAVAVGAACLVLSLFILADVGDWAKRRFEEKMIDALDLIHAAVAGGLPPRQALLVAARSAPKPVARQLNDLVRRLDLGLSVEKAVEPLLLRYNTEGVRLFCQALIAKWHSGSDFGLMIKSVNTLMRDQLRLRSLIDGQLSGARYAAIFTGMLPYLLVPLFLWKEPDWFAPLHQNPTGASFLLGAIFLQLFAYLWLRRLLRSQ